MNVAFFARPDGGETGVLVVGQQTIRQHRTNMRRYKAGRSEEFGAQIAPFVALARHGA